jgi:hypothetical protein
MRAIYLHATRSNPFLNGATTNTENFHLLLRHHLAGVRFSTFYFEDRALRAFLHSRRRRHDHLLLLQFVALLLLLL